LNPLIAQYESTFTSDTPYVQLTMGGVGNVLADQTAWSSALTAGSVTASEQNGVVTVSNTGTGSTNVPITTPQGTTVNGAAFGSPYDGQLSAWTPIAAGSSATLDEKVSPTITSAATANSIVGAPFSFTVTTTGDPAPTLSETGSLPSGLTFTDNGDGTATISGTPAATTGGSFPITINATSSSGSTAQSFTLTNSEAPTITSPTTASFIVGTPSTYTVTTTGYPAATITESGTLPPGTAFTDNGDGTATISGTPTGSGGTYPVTISATNSSGSTATLDLSMTVNVETPPTITSSATAYFTLDSAGAVAVTTTGTPTPAITEVGALPAGLTFVDNGNGTALLSGTPTATGTTALDITAANGDSPDATQTLTVIVGQAPSISSAASATAVVGTASSFTVTTTGYPAPAIGETGALPSGVTFTDNGNGTATLGGTPAASTAGTYPITIDAVNGTGSATQNFTLTVQQPPAFTSATSTTFSENTAGSFAVTATGVTPITYSETGALPSGVTLASDGTLSGTPAFGTAGSYPVTITATDANNNPTTQSFTLTVSASPPVFTSATSTAFSENVAGNFAVTANGDTPLSYTETGELPSGVTLAADGVLSGTPDFGTAGSYPITITATDANNNSTTQSFTLTETTSPPEFTSATSTTFSENTAGSFAVTANGDTPITYSVTGSLPSGVTLASNGTLSGTPAFGTAGSYPVTITATDANNNSTTQSFTLTVSASPPVFTSATSTSFSENTAGNFAVAANGDTPIAYSETGALPSGVTLDSNGILSGTPDFGTAGSYPITITATDANSNTTAQSFTLTVGATAPAFVSATSTSFRENNADSFAVTANGDAPISYSETGALPSGVTLAADGTLSGTPAFSSGGNYPITITATDGNNGTTNQNFTLTVSATAPVITSADSTTFSENASGGFAVAGNGDNPLTFTVTNGSLPSGVSLATDGTLSGTPAFGTAGTYPITITATDVHDQTTAQSFSLTVSASPPVFTSAMSTALSENTAGSFAITSDGDSPLTYSETGALPSGIALASNGILSGTPAFGTAGTYPITITATDANSNHTAQSFTLTVGATAPVFTSAASITFRTNTAGRFAFTANGDTPLSYSEIGTLPEGVTLASNGILSGTPALGTAGSYPITITATDGNGDDLPLTTSQPFMLVVNEAPLFTSPASATFTKGVSGTFSVKFAGAPTPTLTESGSLPPGIRFANGTIRGTPTALGTFHLTFTANNGVGPKKVQHFTLTVLGFHIVSTTLPTGTKGKAYSAKLSAIGGSAPYAWATSNGHALSKFGLSLTMNGVVHGTPRRTGTLRFNAQASFRAGSKAQVVKSVITLVITG
jgi:D-hexose-6-phosphate mutarotase